MIRRMLGLILLSRFGIGDGGGRKSNGGRGGGEGEAKSSLPITLFLGFSGFVGI